jgi:predicted GH43/DUF377 family glycosyl hydrolase
MIERFAENPLITPADVKPSHPDLEVWRTFNAGATLHKGKTVLLLRVAERPKPRKGSMGTAYLDLENPGACRVRYFKLTDPKLDLADPRGVFFYDGVPYLPQVSHIRMAVSDDGRRFTVAGKPALAPEFDYEVYGVEDPRITQLGNWYYINYSAIAPNGVTTALARTRDFQRYEKLGIIFCPDNKDVAIFPEKIGGLYACLHRPSMKQIGAPAMWLAFSENLLDWGRHRFIMGPRPGKWDSERVGCGAPCFRTRQGWLQIYHGCNSKIRYCSSAVLLDLQRPWKVIARSDEALLAPSAPYEMEGFLPNVIFHNGLVVRDDGGVDLYYGAADTTVCGARMDVEAVLRSLKG